MDSVVSTSSLYRKMIDALSVRNLEKYRATGREQFFATFNRFGAVYRDRPLRKGDALAELVRRAASQNVQHVEVIINDSHGRADSIASTVSYTDDWRTLRSRLLDAGLRTAVQQGRTFLTQAEQRADSLLNCHTSPTPAACAVTRRYRMYAVRVGSPVQVSPASCTRSNEPAPILVSKPWTWSPRRTTASPSGITTSTCACFGFYKLPARPPSRIPSRWDSTPEN